MLMNLIQFYSSMDAHGNRSQIDYNGDEKESGWFYLEIHPIYRIFPRVGVERINHDYMRVVDSCI